MTRMTGPDCAVTCNLINIHIYIEPTYLHTYIQTCTPASAEVVSSNLTKVGFVFFLS